ncbi:hypothetical protein AK812_SmicGene47237, partial [Symbiodinium microadriaticum]
MPPKKSVALPPGVPANWSAWRLTQDEQATIKSQVDAKQEELKGDASLTAAQKKVELKDFKTNLEVTAKQMKAKAAEEKKASKKGAGPAAAGGTAAAEAAGPSASAGTGEYWQMVQSDIAKILKHFGDDFAKKPALAIEVAGKVDQGGIQAPWAKDEATRSMGNQGTYVAGANLFWLDFLQTASPSVPLSRKSVEDLAEFMYPQADLDQGVPPRFFDKMLRCIAPCARTEAQPDHPSGCRMISPEGLPHALLAAAARDLPRNLKNWMVIFRSITMKFEDLPLKDLWVENWKARNAVLQDYESLSRTAYQTALEVAALKKTWEDDEATKFDGTRDLLEKFRSVGLSFVGAGKKEELTENFLASCLAVAREFTGDQMVVPLLHLQEMYESSSCLNKMTNLALLAQKPAARKREWVVQSIYHGILRNREVVAAGIRNEEVVKGWLLGDKHAAGWIAVSELKK